MGRAYAGVLGYLAATLTFARGVYAGSGAASTVLVAVSTMALFAAIGFVLGTIAQTTVDQSVHQQLEAELAATGAQEIS